MSWLCYEHQWAEWELLTIAITVLVLLLLIVRLHRKGMVRKARANQVRGRSSIKGIKISGHKRSRQGIKVSEKDHLARVQKGDEGQKKWRKTIKQLKKLNGQIEQLQHQATKRKQATKHFKQQVTELTSANEKLRHAITEHKQTTKHLKQQVTKLMSVNEKLQHGLTDRKRAEERLKQQAGKVPVDILLRHSLKA
jgi:chromosome segregation ATPase